MSEPVETNGWHTVTAISYKDVNRAIASAKGPSSFSQQDAGGSASITGTCGPWQLTTGGSGPLLMMALPILDGKIAIGPNTYLITPCTATVKITATYISSHDAKMDLVNDPSQAATVMSCVPAQKDFLADAVLQKLLNEWLTSNLGMFSAVFATVDFDAQYATDGLKWLKPSDKGYAVAEPMHGATLSNSVFGVLCLIDGDTQSDGLVWQISPQAIPPGADAAFIVSQETFLQHMLLAAVPSMFKGIGQDPPEKHFAIDNLGTRILNTGTVTLLPVKLSNGRVVTPSVQAKNFAIQLDESELEIAITDMEFEFSPGITVKLTYNGRCTISLDNDHHILQLKVTTQSGSGSVQVSKGLQIAQIVLGVASVVLSLVGGVGGAVGRSASAAVTTATEATLGTAEAVGEDAATSAQAAISCCRGLISGTPAEISEIAARCFTVARVGMIGAFATTLMPAITQILVAVESGDYKSMPKITDLTGEAVGKTVIWPTEVGEFKLASAGLNGAFQFGLAHVS